VSTVSPVSFDPRRRTTAALTSVFDSTQAFGCNSLIGEVAERSKALDWNSSNIFTGVRGFESHPLRQIHERSVMARIGSFRDDQSQTP
jgi:hypothetical protein